MLTCRHFCHLILYHIPHLASLVFFSFEYFDPYDHYAVCWFTLIFSPSSISIIMIPLVV